MERVLFSIYRAASVFPTAVCSIGGPANYCVLDFWMVDRARDCENDAVATGTVLSARAIVPACSWKRPKLVVSGRGRTGRGTWQLRAHFQPLGGA